MRKIALIAGTRPEIIKLAPVYSAVRDRGGLLPIWIATGQHQELATQALAPFKIVPDFQLNAMLTGQSLNQLLARLLNLLSDCFETSKPDCVVVQGDTTSALAASLAAFQLQIPVAHVEAGLRTHNLRSPFPEEANRQLISRLASLHLCPTTQAANNLRLEGVTDHVAVTGNTIVDALEQIKPLLVSLQTSAEPLLAKLHSDRLILVTAHRRENFDKRLEYLCQSLLNVLRSQTNLQIALPVHLNPNVREPVQSLLSNQPRLHLLEPVDYPSLLKLMQRATVIVTDSGGIQEEAPSFGKYVIVTRDTTERPELIAAGMGELCPLSPEHNLEQVILNRLEQQAPTTEQNPFGDGQSASRIAESLMTFLSGGS